MPSQVIALANVKLIYDGIPADGDLITVGDGVGTTYTYVASGTTGQTTLIEGSLGGGVWVSIALLTVGAANAAVVETYAHAYKTLRLSGDARVQVARGEA